MAWPARSRCERPLSGDPFAGMTGARSKLTLPMSAYEAQPSQGACAKFMPASSRYVCYAASAALHAAAPLVGLVSPD